MRNGLHLRNLWAVYGKDDAVSQKVIKRLLRCCLVNYLPIWDIC